MHDFIFITVPSSTNSSVTPNNEHEGDDNKSVDQNLILRCNTRSSSTDNSTR